MATETLTNFTYDELLEMPDDGRHYEILDGELIVNAAPIPRHQEIAFNIASILRAYVKPRDIGIVRSIVTGTNVSGAPDLAVEVLSDSTRKRDEITKRRAYEDFGVGGYWIVDPELEALKVHRRNEAGRYERVIEVSTETDGAVITSPLFPGLEISLAEVFS